MRCVLVVNLRRVVDLLVSDFVDDSLPALEVLTAVTGGEALELARQAQGRIDLAILNQRLPEMTGLELLGELGRIVHGAPLVVCVPRNEGRQARKVRGLGHEVLELPVDRDLLRALVEQHLLHELPPPPGGH